MSCQKLRDWLENSSNAGLEQMPAELQAHLSKCPACAALIRKINELCSIRLPKSILVCTPSLRKSVMSRLDREKRHSNTDRGYNLQILWKLALFPFLIVFAIALFCLYPGSGSSITEKSEIVAVVSSLNNNVQRQGAAAKEFSPLLPEDKLVAGDAIRTGRDSSVELLFVDGSVVSLGSETWFKVTGEHSRCDQSSGRAVFKIKKQLPHKTFEIVSPHGLTAVLGTSFVQEINEHSGFVAVSEGLVKFQPNYASASHLLKKGHLAIFNREKNIVELHQINPEALAKLFDLSSSVDVKHLISPQEVPEKFPPTSFPDTIVDDKKTPVMQPQPEPKPLTGSDSTDQSSTDTDVENIGDSHSSYDSEGTDDSAELDAENTSYDHETGTSENESVNPGGAGHSTLGVSGM